MSGETGRKRIFLIAAVVLGTLVLCGICLASGEPTAEQAVEHHAPIWDLIARFINFALLVIILVVVFKKVNLGGLLSARREELKRRMEELRSSKEEAERRYQELEKRIREFEQSKQAILERFRAEGIAEKNRLISEAEQRVKQILAQAEGAIQREMESARGRLKQDMLSLAAQNAEKIIAREMTDNDQERLVDEFIERLGKAN